MAKEIPQEVKPTKPVKVSVRAVFGGPMVNPLNEDRFTGEPSKPVVIDAWLAVQIDAGKIEIVE
jgi:hypothetical protein